MKAARCLSLGGFALLLIATACTTQAPREPPTSGAGQQRTSTLDPWDEDRTALALGTRAGTDHELIEHLTEEANREAAEEYRNHPATEAAEERVHQATVAAKTNAYEAAVTSTMEQERQEAVRDCILAGNDDTLCLMDQDDPSLR